MKRVSSRNLRDLPICSRDLTYTLKSQVLSNTPVFRYHTYPPFQANNPSPNASANNHFDPPGPSDPIGLLGEKHRLVEEIVFEVHELPVCCRAVGRHQQEPTLSRLCDVLS